MPIKSPFRKNVRKISVFLRNRIYPPPSIDWINKLQRNIVEPRMKDAVYILKWEMIEMFMNIVLTVLYFFVLGAVVHKIMGKDGGVLHYAFIGGSGVGIGALLEYISGFYTKTFIAGVILCVICACGVEWIVRRIKKHIYIDDKLQELD